MDILCPSCSRDGLMCWDSMSFSPGAALKEKALVAALFQWHCPICGQEYNFSTSCLYHDEPGRYAIWLRPDGSDAPDVPERAPGGPPAAGMILRRVGNINELIEKIKIFDAGLDDRVVEALKTFLRASCPQDVKERATAMLFVGEGADGNEIRCIAALGDGSAREAALDKKYYAEMKNALAFTSTFAEAEFGFAVVDGEWARRAMGEMG